MTKNISIEIITDRRGEFAVHMNGCRDIKRSSMDRHSGAIGGGGEIYESIDLVAAIRLADQAFAEMFCRNAYDGKDDEIGESLWNVAVIEWAPCFAKAVKAERLTFGEQGLPIFPKATTATATESPVVVADTTCRGKWSMDGCENNARSAKWLLCESCTADRKVAMDLGYTRRAQWDAHIALIESDEAIARERADAIIDGTTTFGETILDILK